MGRIVGKNNRDYYVIDDLRKSPELKPLFEECVRQVTDDTARINKKYPPRIVVGPDDILNNSVLEFYLEEAGQKGLDYEEAKAFCEKMRRLFGWNEIHYSLQKWVWRILRNPHYHNVNHGKDTLYEEWVRNEDDGGFEIREDVFKLACYIGIGFMKHGASYDYLNANEIFGWVTDLGSKEVAKLKKFGSGELPVEVTEYKDDEVVCKANDAFATIKITLKAESESAYAKVLEFLCKLLEAGFPKSYAIDFKSPDKDYLPIKKLPKKGVNQLFANAVKYPALYADIERYARLAVNEFEWYQNLQDENCAMPGTFAVFALGLVSLDLCAAGVALSGCMR